MTNETVTRSGRFYCVSVTPDICKTPVGASTPPLLKPVVTKPNSFEHMIRLLVAIDMVTDFDTSAPRHAVRVFAPDSG